MSKAKILIVEDQSLISTNIRLLLKFRNYDVCGIAETAEEALSIIEQEMPDLILMDILLPGDMDGIELANIIIEKWKLPVIYITARKDQATIERAKKSSPYGYITKDIELKEQLPIVVEFALFKHKTEIEKEITRQELADSEEKFRSIASSAMDAVIILDNDGTITFWNESSTKIFGYTQEEALGKSLSSLIAPNAYMDYYENGFSDFSESGQGNFTGKTIELESLKKDGGIIPIEVSMASFKLKDKWCACCIIRDISVRKTIENEVERLIEELQISKDVIEQNVNDVLILNEKLRESEEKLQELNISKDRFFSIIAHDLKGPFQGLLGFSEILSKDIESLSRLEIKEFASDLNESAKQLFKLLENLLHWTRLQRGRIEWEPSYNNIKQLTDMTFDLTNFQAKQKGITLINNIYEDCMIYADLNMVNTILRNLISNAIKFTNINGTISVSAKDIDKNYVEISVKDTGIGMDESGMKKLFKIDVHHTTPGTAREKGTGLGLILCKELIEKNNGTIRVESEVNSGTTFYFTLLKTNN